MHFGCAVFVLAHPAAVLAHPIIVLAHPAAVSAVPSGGLAVLSLCDFFSQNLEDTIIMCNFVLHIVNSCVQSMNNDKEGN